MTGVSGAAGRGFRLFYREKTGGREPARALAANNADDAAMRGAEHGGTMSARRRRVKPAGAGRRGGNSRPERRNIPALNAVLPTRDNRNETAWKQSATSRGNTTVRKLAANRRQRQQGSALPMTFDRPLLELELRPVAAPAAASAGARVYALLPTLEELVGRPGFGRRNAICMPGFARPYDPLRFFSTGFRPPWPLH